jgi:hypothetical protein
MPTEAQVCTGRERGGLSCPPKHRFARVANDGCYCHQGCHALFIEAATNRVVKPCATITRVVRPEGWGLSCPPGTGSHGLSGPRVLPLPSPGLSCPVCYDLLPTGLSRPAVTVMRVVTPCVLEAATNRVVKPCAPIACDVAIDCYQQGCHALQLQSGGLSRPVC